MSGTALQQAELAIKAGDRFAARTLLSRLLSAEPRNVHALHLMSVLDLSERNQAAARVHIDQILKIEPGHASANLNLGVIAMQEGDFATAIACFRKTLSAQPGHTGALYNLGQMLRSIGQHGDALKEFRRLTTAAPAFMAGWESLAETQIGIGQSDDALKTCERAERHVRPSGHLLRLKGDALRRAGRLSDAVTAYRASLAALPDNPDTLHNLSRTYYLQGDLEEALALQERQLEVVTSVPAHRQHISRARCETIRQRIGVAKWDGMGPLVDAALEQVKIDGTGLDPFLTTLLVEDGSLVRKSALAVWNGMTASDPGTPVAASRKGDRLRVGYVSADFHDHPVTHLMSRVFELHDRSGFEIFAYSAGHDVNSSYRRRVERAVDQFRDVRNLDDEALAARIKRDNIDVLVDLMGHTRNNRLQMFRRRPAPVSAHLIGFPGTIGGTAIDYFIADPVSLPKSMEAHFDEAIARLPGTYHPTDNSLALPRATTNRSDHLLPPHGFVFAAFVQTSKLNAPLMDVQACILERVPGSVLWLAEEHPKTIERLREEIERRGVDGRRLVFAPRVPYTENLDRLTHADLVLDSWPYGGHTTTSNALWSGVPVLTKVGRSFAAQAPSSLILAADLPEMIARDTAHFVELAVRHALDATYHDAIRRRLEDSRKTCRLFDTVRYTRDLERTFQRMHERACRGLPPQTFSTDQVDT